MPRVLAMAAVATAAFASLTACDKPLPQVTVLSGSTTVVVGAQTYCADPTHCHLPRSHVPTVHAHAGATLFVDVPRQIADHPWSVLSGTFVGNSSFKSFVGDNYSTGAISHTHSARVDVPFGVGSYSIAIKTNLATWIAQVKVTR